MKPKGSGQDPVDLVLSRTVITRLGCWECQNKPGGTGYIIVQDQRGEKPKSLLAHRVIYEHFKGPIPVDKQLDHLCRNRICVNPDHLEPVTAWENQHRSPLTSAGKTHCPKNHPYEGDNLYVNPAGKRLCRTCRTEQWRARRARK